jgi:hypothetical protein
MAASLAHMRHGGNLACSNSACNASRPEPGSRWASAWTVARHSVAALWMGCYDRGTAWRAMTVQGDEWRELIYLTGSFLNRAAAINA